MSSNTSDTKAAHSAVPPPPFPIGPASNCKRVGWDAFFQGRARNSCPFPPGRRDLKAGYEEGWDAAALHTKGEME